MLIQGTISGAAQGQCTIEIGGKVVVEQSVTCAKIQARDIVIKGDVEQCSLQSELGAKIGGSVSETQVSLGNRSGDLRALRQIGAEIQRMQRELKVRTGSAARHFVRNYPEVDLKMGNILVPQRRGLSVDLAQFYKAIEKSDSAQIDRALEEFYLRVVVGMLTRSNRHYISWNPSRHKVFLKLIEELRNHVLAVRAVDKLQDRVREGVGHRGALFKELKGPTEATLWVGGAVGADVVVQLLKLQNIQDSPTGNIDIEKATAEAKTVRTEEGFGVEATDVSGEVQVVRVAEDQMHNGSFVLQDETVVWRSGE